MLNQYISFNLICFFLSLFGACCCNWTRFKYFSALNFWVLERDMEPIDFYPTPPSTCCILCRVLSLWWEMETLARECLNWQQEVDFSEKNLQPSFLVLFKWDVFIFLLFVSFFFVCFVSEVYLEGENSVFYVFFTFPYSWWSVRISKRQMLINTASSWCNLNVSLRWPSLDCVCYSSDRKVVILLQLSVKMAIISSSTSGIEVEWMNQTQFFF